MDKQSKYVINDFPYFGKDKMHSENERVSDRAVTQRMRSYLNTGKKRHSRSLFYLCETSHSTERKANESFGNSKENQERSAATFEKDRRASFLQGI